MRVVVTGGGTGGHIYPALAVAAVLKADPSVEAVAYIGKSAGLESELVPQAGIAFHGISFSGMPRLQSTVKAILYPFWWLGWFWQLQQAVKKSRALLKELKPNVVFGTGGYVSAPVLIAAKSLKIPFVIHEPDAHPGLVNRLMAKDAAMVTTSFGEGARQLSVSHRVLVTGNPIRGEIGHLSKAQAMAELGLEWPAEQLVLLVTGGSQGARKINQAVVGALPDLLDRLNLAVVHLTGQKLYEETMASVPEAYKTHLRYRVQPYEPNMAMLLALADVALCRAGSLSLSEMYVCGLPTILVPYPFAAADHQRKNAEASVRSGASVMLLDEACTPEALIQMLTPLVVDMESRNAMRQAALALAHPDATAQIVATLQQVAKQK